MASLARVCSLLWGGWRWFGQETFTKCPMYRDENSYWHVDLLFSLADIQYVYLSPNPNSEMYTDFYIVGIAFSLTLRV